MGGDLEFFFLHPFVALSHFGALHFLAFLFLAFLQPFRNFPLLLRIRQTRLFITLAEKHCIPPLFFPFSLHIRRIHIHTR